MDHGPGKDKACSAVQSRPGPGGQQSWPAKPAVPPCCRKPKRKPYSAAVHRGGQRG